MTVNELIEELETIRDIFQGGDKQVRILSFERNEGVFDIVPEENTISIMTDDDKEEI